MPSTENSPNPPRGWLRPYRSSRRQRIHDEALAEDTSAPPAAVPDHPLVPANAPRMVEAPEDLEQLLANLRTEPRFGYDSEFIGEHSYFPKLCLIQVSTPQDIVLIDALADLNLAPFWDLITDSTIEKIVHCGIQDLEPAYRHCGRPPANIFDTQLSAAFIGAGYPRGLASMIDEFLEIQLANEMKFTQWDTRPLSARQLAYAANDVRYLHLLRDTVAARLDDTGHTQWAAEQCEGLCAADAYRFDPTNEKLMRRGMGGLGQVERRMLEDLITWRDTTAREEDVPPRSLIRDGILLEMCRREIRSMDDLHSVRGLPRPVIRHCGQDLLRVVEAAQHRKGTVTLRTGPIPPDHRDSFNQMWRQVRACCDERGIDPAVVTNKQHVILYFRNMLLDRSNKDSPMLRGWRRELLGPILDDWYDAVHHG